MPPPRLSKCVTAAPARVNDMPTFNLHAVEEPALTAQRGTMQQRRERDAPRGIKRVLVVDDSREIRELERRLLAHRGYDVELAVDGIDAWNAIRTREFDLLLTDIEMPLIDGIELIRLIRKDPAYATLL